MAEAAIIRQIRPTELCITGARPPERCMPAFGPSTDDRMLWNVAAFVKQLPAMTPEQYAQIGKPQRSASQAGGAP